MATENQSVRGKGPNGGRSNENGQRNNGTDRKPNGYRRPSSSGTRQ